jgi:D-beta-D-heptose 7-phosphate kinase/D-beta-D-heptose 1-phosphate adenosyltransferase
MNVLVIGDCCEDHYVYCSSERFCPDAPVPILNPIKSVKSLGMAGNVSDNLKSLGASIYTLFNTEKIKKTRYVHERTNHMFIRIDEGENNINPIKKESLEKIEWEKYDAVVISDYCKGFITEDSIKYISEHHSLTFLDTKKQLGIFANNITFLKINDIEYNKTESTLFPDLYKKTIITLGSRGALYQEKKYNVDEVDVRDTSGAGDTFLAGLVYGYTKTRNIDTSINFANMCASQVVQKKGTAKVNKNQLKYEI